MRSSNLLAGALLATLSVVSAAFAASPAPSEPELSAVARLTPSSPASCPATVAFAADITAIDWPATGAREVQYHWIRSDGVTIAAKPLSFSPAAPATQTVTMTWTLAASTSGYVALVIDAPQTLQSNKAVFALSCNGSTASLGDGSGSGTAGAGTAMHPVPSQSPDSVASHPGAPPTPPGSAVPTPTPFALRPPPIRAVTVSASAAVEPEKLVAPCPYTVRFVGTLSIANLLPKSAAKVSYHWVLSDGFHSAEQTIAATNGQVVTTQWMSAVSTSGSATLWIDAPNVTTSLPAKFSLQCPPHGGAILNPM